MGEVLTAAINSTDYYNGLFGLGIIQGRFGDFVHDSPLTQAVKQYGQIPSYSYGYTAGAYYGECASPLISGDVLLAEHAPQPAPPACHALSPWEATMRIASFLTTSNSHSHRTVPVLGSWSVVSLFRLSRTAAAR